MLVALAAIPLPIRLESSTAITLVYIQFGKRLRILFHGASGLLFTVPAYCCFTVPADLFHGACGFLFTVLADLFHGTRGFLFTVPADLFHGARGFLVTVTFPPRFCLTVKDLSADLFFTVKNLPADLLFTVTSPAK